jgi:ATP-binding cassette subfamily F protein uup
LLRTDKTRESDKKSAPKKGAEKKEADKNETDKKISVQTEKTSVKLSYKLQRELEALPAQIEQLETDIADLTEQTQQPSFFSQARSVTDAVLQQIAEKQAALDACYERWAELDG